FVCCHSQRIYLYLRFFLLTLRPPPTSTLFPYTTLFRSYRSGDSELRACIMTSCLEHLFESRRIAAYFSDWQEDPILAAAYTEARSEEHTSELQSRGHLVCRLLLEKKKQKTLQCLILLQI